MNLFSISDLYDLCLRYADIESIISLKHTCKDLYQKIPESWCMDKLNITEKEIQEIDYRFMSHLYCLYAPLEIMNLNYKSFRSLREVYLMKVNKLSKIRFDPKTNLIQDIFINHAHSLDVLDIPKEYTKLKILYIAYTNISKLTISETWISLKTIVLIGLFQLSDLVIPKECNSIEFINISKSSIENVYLYPTLNQNLIIRTTFFPVCVHTHASNHIHIIKTDSVFLKSLK